MGNEGKDYILHKPGVKKKNIKKIMGETIEQHYTYTLADRELKHLINFQRAVLKTGIIK